MRRFSKLRPSPALVISLIALFVALGGVGYAAATIGSGQIKNNSVRGKDIRNRTIASKDVKKNLFEGKAKWANVASNGTITYQSGGVTINHPSTGLYFLHFNTAVPKKLVVATPRETIDTTVLALPCGGGPGAGTCSPAFDRKTLLVRVRTTGGVDADRAFFAGVLP
jgi:hypothetical protein